MTVPLLERLWAWRLRRFDLRMYWPIYRADAPDIERARRLFLLHARREPAWRILGDDEICRRIAALT